jgi:cell division septation protein DedD
MSDEGFHEINLNGKQLVFLFMAAAVVGVVVFLAGVMVGRGVRAEKAAAVAGESAPVAQDLAAPGAAPPAVSPGTVEAVPPGGDAVSARPAAPPATPPPPVADDIARDLAPGERGAAATAPAPSALTADKGAVPASGRDAGSKPAPASSPDATGAAAKTPARSAEAAMAWYAVQVAAPKERGAAEAIAKRLVGKGYAAYVLDPSAGSAGPAYYRVRVGPYKTRREADEAKRRLEKEEQFKPFITR